MKHNNHYDCVVIGGGAAGMFSAALISANGYRVALIEHNARLGKKLAITGKGRCNLTNACSAQEVLAQTVHNARFLYSAMEATPPSKIMEFFQAHGCPLKTERGNRVFPVSDCAADVVSVLQEALATGHVHIIQDHAEKLLAQDGQITGVQCTSHFVAASTILLATGGCSYPGTGSDGSGYRLAQALGHTLVEPRGSLVPLCEDGTWCAQMQGLSLRNVGLRMVNQKGKTVYEDFGELLFTHYGLSGPTVLSASAHMHPRDRYVIYIDLKPALDEKKLDARLLRDLASYQNRTMEHALMDLYPRSLIPVILQRAEILPDLQANSLTKQQRRRLLELTKAFPVAIKGCRPVAEAIVTAGGISVKEIQPKTMESKKIHGLFFAGEVMDLDAYTGGFNLQIAWATAAAAATGICAQCSTSKNPCNP